ncbi:MAG TPA: Ku protein [Steroidobacteraceae bacterium]|nr:Ku protein [Steroidobacteraceae bacterium]
MAARAIWKGEIHVGSSRVPVKFYSAIEDRKVHFRLLHDKDHAPVVQRIVRKDTGEEVPREDQRKAFPVSREQAVILQPEELDALEPPASREIHLCRFVAPELLSDQWYDRPYFLGPDADESSYFALAEALDRTAVIGIARWVMRKKRYIGALGLTDGYLRMATLRRADQVLTFAGIVPTKATSPNPSELKLAQQLVESIAGDLDPASWHDEYRERVWALIEAKMAGRTVTPIKRRRKAPEASLADSLKASIAAARERRVA